MKFICIVTLDLIPGFGGIEGETYSAMILNNGILIQNTSAKF